MTDDHNDSGSIFEGMFAQNKRTDDEREQQERQRERERNDAAERAFEKERDRRSDHLHMDQRIRNIVSGEINKVFLMGVVLAALYSIGGKYGWPAGVGVLIIAGAIWWWEDRKAQKLPRFKIDEVDELAEDTVTHERIAAYEREGRPWCWVKGDYVRWEGFFDHPFWDDVNKQVRSYVTMSHQKRTAHNREARNSSLPYRIAMQTRLRSQGEDWDLPGWARLDRKERK